MERGGTARLAFAPLVLLAPVVLFACGASENHVAQTPKRNPFHRAASSPRQRPRTSVDAGADVAAVPAAPKTVIVMPPFAGRAVFLYPDELEALRTKFVRVLGAVNEPDFVPLADDKMRALLDRAKAGKLLEGGPVCAKAPTLEDVVDAETKKGQDDQTDVASLMLECDVTDGCTLQISIGAIEGEREADLMLEAKVTGDDAKANIDRWLAAVDDLAQTDELFATGYGMAAPSGLDPVVAKYVDAVGDLGAEKPVPSPAALAACHDGSPSRRDALAYRPLVSLDSSGKVDRCSTASFAPTKKDACVCGAFEKLKFAKEGKSDGGKPSARRVVYDVVDVVPAKKSARNFTAQVTMLDAGGRDANAFDIPALKDCYLGVPSSKDDLTFEVKLALDPAGHVTKTELPATVPTQMRACLTRAYAATPFTCDADTQAKTVRFSVSVGPGPSTQLVGSARPMHEPDQHPY